MFTICLWLTLLLAGCGMQQRTHVEIENVPNPQASKTKISKEQAVAIARGEALRTHDSLERFKVVGCETARVWVIIYDGGGPEYVISKESGNILGAKNIPQGADSGDGAIRTVNEQEAIDEAKREASTLLSDNIGRYNVFACELAKAWLVSFEYREVPGELLPNSRSPLYVIDKRTGKVIYKEG